MSQMHYSKKILLLAALAAGAATVQGQNKFFSMAEATNGMSSTLAVKSIRQGSWQPATGHFYQVANNAWVRTGFPEGKTDTVLRLSALNAMLAGKDTLKNFPFISWLTSQSAVFEAGSHVYKLIVDNAGAWRVSPSINLPEDAENLFVDKNDKLIAFTVDNNIRIINKDGRTLNVTNDADKNIVNGHSVHRDEFGIDHGIFLSPQGSLVAYYRMDQTMVSDYPVIDWSVTPAKNTNIKYPMAGRTSHQVTLHVYNPANGQTVAIKTEGPKDQYLTGVTWSPDEQSVFIAILNRDQNHLWLNQYDVATGNKIKTLFEETDPKYVHPEHGLSFLPGSKDEFVWWSQRDGYDHLYLYKTDGKLVRQLTKGPWVVNELLGFNSERNEVLFTASKESPLDKNSYRVNWKNGKMTRIDAEPGMHNVLASGDGKYIYDVFSAAGVPRKSLVRSTDGAMTKLLLESPDPLAEYKRPEIRNITLKADDGTPLYGKLILPVNFDSSRKYPVIVYLYNGPNVQLIHNQFPESGNLWYEYMAQRGYVVFTMDGRGSSNRGKAFEQATFRRLGTVELQDQLQGVAFLKSLRYVDPARMGIHGWSFGGFMTTSMMLRYPDVFKCAVAGGPVIDWRMYEVMYTERYMDTPQDNPQGYADADLLTKVKQLKGKLLLIHGTNDDVVVWQHSIDLLKKSVDEGIQLDYFVYPGHPHNVRGKDRIHLMQKITDYFDMYLKP